MSKTPGEAARAAYDMTNAPETHRWERAAQAAIEASDAALLSAAYRKLRGGSADDLATLSKLTAENKRLTERIAELEERIKKPCAAHGCTCGENWSRSE